MMTPFVAACRCDAFEQNKESAMKTMQKFAALLLLLIAGVTAGCNTMEGLGRDIDRGGEKIQDSARDVRQRM
jgi:entericidin B